MLPRAIVAPRCPATVAMVSDRTGRRTAVTTGVVRQEPDGDDVVIRLDDDMGRSDAVALARVRGWVAELAGTGDETTVVVTELACREEGCPPIETVVALLTPQGRWHRTIHRPAAELTVDDVRTLLADRLPAR